MFWSVDCFFSGTCYMFFQCRCMIVVRGALRLPLLMIIIQIIGSLIQKSQTYTYIQYISIFLWLCYRYLHIAFLLIFREGCYPYVASLNAPLSLIARVCAVSCTCMYVYGSFTCRYQMEIYSGNQMCSLARLTWTTRRHTHIQTHTCMCSVFHFQTKSEHLTNCWHDIVCHRSK